VLSIESQLFAEEEILRLQAHARSERGSHQRQQIGETSQQESANRWSGSHGSEILADNGEVSMKNATHALPAADGKGARLPQVTGLDQFLRSTTKNLMNSLRVRSNPIWAVGIRLYEMQG